MKAVDINTSNSNSTIGFVSGVIGGLGKFLLNINANYWQNLLEAGFTALICGALGVAGKEVYTAIKKRLNGK